MLYDISPLLSSSTPVWPGDEPFIHRKTVSMDEGEGCNVSALQASAHFGSHADAPLHFIADGKSIDEVSLHHFLGTCQVMTVPVQNGSEIKPSDLPTKVLEARLLLKTGTFPSKYEFTTDYAALSVELVEDLFLKGVITIGVDTPSVELYPSTDFSVHKALFQKDMAILEGLRLEDVPDGIYELIALPLKLAGFDGSPVRAVLRKIEKESNQRPEVSLKQSRPFIRSMRRPLTPFP